MADYGRDFQRGRRAFGRERGGYDAGYRSRGGRDAARYGYRGAPDPNRQGYGAEFGPPRTRGWFNPGFMVENAWGGAYSAGDTEYAGRRLFNPDYQTRADRSGRGYDRGYSHRYDREFRHDDPGYGWRRPFGSGYENDR